MKELPCDVCDTTVPVSNAQWKSARYRKRKFNSNFCCSSSCMTKNRGQKDSFEIDCEFCGKSFRKLQCEIDKTNRNFCSRSCACSFSNSNKTFGIRRSKLEFWLEDQLKVLFPNLNVHYSRKDTINSELDIYIPTLNLAFELNGLFHYEPIFGGDKLDQIQNNDNRKFQACLEQGIELCIIDTSQQKKFNESSSKKYLDIVTHLVNLKLSKTDYVEVV